MGTGASTVSITAEQFAERAKIIEAECSLLTEQGLSDSEILEKLTKRHEEITKKFIADLQCENSNSNSESKIEYPQKFTVDKIETSKSVHVVGKKCNPIEDGDNGQPLRRRSSAASSAADDIQPLQGGRRKSIGVSPLAASTRVSRVATSGQVDEMMAAIDEMKVDDISQATPTSEAPIPRNIRNDRVREDKMGGNPLVTRRLTLNKTFAMNYAIQAASVSESKDSESKESTHAYKEDKETPSSKSRDPMTGMDIASFEAKCYLCNMVFLNKVRLDRHIKFSELHSQNLLKHEENQVIELAAEELAQKGLVQNYNLNYSSSSSPDAGILIYMGSEYFSRTRDNIDIHIFVHNITQTLEMIPFDIDDEQELPRIYFNIPVFFNVIGNEKMKRVATDLEKQMVDNSLHITPEIQKQSSKLLAMATEVLHHLEIIRVPIGTPVPGATTHKQHSAQSKVFSEDRMPMPVAPVRSKRQSMEGLEKRLAFKSLPDDKTNQDPIILDPYIPKTIVSRNTRLKETIRKPFQPDIGDLSEVSTIETVLLSRKHLQTAVIAAGKLLDIPHRAKEKPRRRASSFV
mmetsp:Transcript_40835/g.41703  ORF Transcript_40835/g.41703 Transcript_40835/m.41703 type:complete len:574 (+) Transcript_40835:225-1946(+)|eukprot:CAMPEP_0182435212 /NCGR_PEP_ID=MMETSP1167-20130531/74406_1 /TAXON_ID=2988 /ORGANISM="Mallomonas Sp, Strain CCMP3275" /LENGTH=573 /DNA_ID=CAMNT_0024625997 /DNA_START=174 /DNA_END=1895 /DNA_ORIENTATION=-